MPRMLQRELRGARCRDGAADARGGCHHGLDPAAPRRRCRPRIEV